MKKYISIVLFILLILLIVTFIGCGETQNNNIVENNIVENNEVVNDMVNDDINDSYVYEAVIKTGDSDSTFYGNDIVNSIRTNIMEDQEKIELVQKTINACDEVISMSDEELWKQMFGPELLRSHYVQANGICPDCGEVLKLYSWEYDAENHPWKAICPTCGAIFPTNDFKAYYESGLDSEGRFSYDIADSSLLFNVEHPDPNDPLHMYGVDDGNGFLYEGILYKFIGAYITQEHWGNILKTIEDLSDAYIYTGDQIYAHKCAILLDRIADFWPEFDYATQGIMYDDYGSDGYVRYWQNSNTQVRTMALAYDKIVDGIQDDTALVEFSKLQKEEYTCALSKDSIEDISNNIKTRIFEDTLNSHKADAGHNFPMKQLLQSIIHAVIRDDGYEEIISELLEEIIDGSTIRNGVSEEDGLTGYTRAAKGKMSEAIYLFKNLTPTYIDDVIRDYPLFTEAYDFYNDTLCLDAYYPQIGDSGAFAEKEGRVAYYGNYELYFLWKLYDVTEDTKYIKALYSITQDDPEKYFNTFLDISKEEKNLICATIRQVIEEEGSSIINTSVVKDEFGLAILRSGEEDNRRALWIAFSLSGGHGHTDLMNIGYYYKGIDLMPDWGYPSFADTDEVRKFEKSPSVHNGLTMNGGAAGISKANVNLFTSGKMVDVLSLGNPELLKKGEQYERTLNYIDISEEDSYFIDVVRMSGFGTKYERFMHAAVGSVELEGTNVIEKENDLLGYVQPFIENFKADESPDFGWSADFSVVDHYNYVDNDYDWHLKCTDLSYDVEMIVADFMFYGNRNYEDLTLEPIPIPGVITRKVTEDVLMPIVMVQLVEPYDTNSKIAEIKRLNVNGKNENYIGVEVSLLDGNTDLVLNNDPYDIATLKQTDWDVETDCMSVVIRKDSEGKVVYAVLSGGTYLNIGDVEISAEEYTNIIEVSFTNNEYIIETGDSSKITIS